METPGTTFTDYPYGVLVKFKEFNGWSKNYRYKSKTQYTVGEDVVVPKGKYYAIARVVRCDENYAFTQEASFYKEILGLLIKNWE